MNKKWVDINQIYFPDGVRSVYFGGKRVKKEDIVIGNTDKSSKYFITNKEMFEKEAYSHIKSIKK